MCGICGIWGGNADPKYTVGRMSLKLKHRGPDGYGIWSDSNTGCTFAHQRLSIIDLSEAGHQPMASHCGRYTICYNGEIYNHLDLRSMLNAETNISWKGHSDTETLVEAISVWGIEKALQNCNGMFAFALWDSHRQVLYLARDRIGEKPLYWGRVGETFVFASELKALHAHPDWTGEIDRNVLALYFRHNYVPSPYSIYRGISKLQPGTWIAVSEMGMKVSEPKAYWSLKEVVESGKRQPFVGSDKEAVDELEELIRKSVGRQMVSDVPLGAFLSGGYDSSAVVALMQEQSITPIRTFSIGFFEKEYNEANYAKAVSAHLGTDHTEVYLTAQDALSVIPELSSIWDEPFSDSSQIPTLLLSRIARKYVTVSLSGDGGDELLCGYKRYERATLAWSSVSKIPWCIREVAGAVLESLPIVNPSLSNRAVVLRARARTEFYHQLISHYRRHNRLVIGSQDLPTALTTPSIIPIASDMREEMMYLDMITYLPDDILVKVDRAAMSASLETRIPLLDRDIIEFAWHLPMNLKIRGGATKWILREVVNRHIPRELMERPKKGFGVPIATWLRGPLKEWASELLKEDRLNRDGYLDSRMITRMWQEHLKGKRSLAGHLWSILTFQSWLASTQKYS